VSAQMMVKAWEEPGLKPSERLVLLALADCADRVGRNAFKSESTIADHTQLSLRTVKRAIAELLELELIEIQERPTNRRSTTYRLFPVYCAALEAAEEQARGGDNLAPPAGRQRGARGGDNVTPLGVTRGVTPGVTRGVTFRDRYKDEPVDPGEPVDPSVVSFLALFALEALRRKPDQPRTWLIDEVRKGARSRSLPHHTAALEAAVDQALETFGSSAISVKSA